MTEDRTRLPDLDVAVVAAEAREAEYRQERQPADAALPLRLWRQPAHLVVPATHDLATKALHRGTAPVAGILERLGVQPTDLAQRLGVTVEVVETLLAHPRPAPVVVVDAEDALPQAEAAVLKARDDAAEVLSSPDDRAGSDRPLRFLRPPAVSDGRGPLVLYGVLWGVSERTGDAASSIDGIVFPKVEHPDEVDLLHLQLSVAEASIGIAAGSLRMALMVETAAAVGHVAEIAARAASRLSSLIFGIADYSADLGLATISNEQATVDWARAAIINAAASVGVPAIDGMTLAFPVSDPDLDGPANRARFLDRMALVYDDAVRARDMGMAGKWVGHPAQLFAVMLAFDGAFTGEHVEREARVLGHRVDGVGGSAGVGMVEGRMADRATDRHSHTFLRRATAMGRFDATRALALGIIDEAELAELSAATAQTEMTR